MPSMSLIRLLRVALLAGCVVFGGSVTAAQVAEGEAAPQTSQEKEYEPSVGQSGKDVVWVPTPQALVDTMLDMAEVTPNDYLIDLGSGDGRTVIAAARRRVRALGIEYNPDMVELSRRRAAEAGVTDLATFSNADIFESDFSDATVITMFLLPSINLKLRPTILDLAPGTRIVSNSFTMAEWEADETRELGGDCTSWCKALLWIVPAKAGGTWRVGDQTLTLRQEFQMLSGTLGSTPIEEGRLRGATISFAAGGRQYTGQVDGTRMTGQVSGGTPATWTATQITAAPIETPTAE
jgi:hypothetical protein